MHKLIIAIFFVLLLTPQSVLAQTTMNASDSATRPKQDAFRMPLKTREAVQDIKQEMKANREQFKERIKLIKDEKKKMIAERIDQRLAKNNENLTDKMSKGITRISMFLAGIKEKAAALASEGKDTTALNAQIASAETAIETAKSAIDTQKAKTYSASVVDETTLKSTMATVVQQFRQDILSTHQTVIAAKTAVMDAARALAALRSVETQATGSAIPNL